MAVHDRFEEVRNHALIALGLLDTPEASAALAVQVRRNPANRLAAVVALGLTTQAESGTDFQRIVVSGQIVEATAAAWSISKQAGNRSFMRAQLVNTENPWIASSALFALSRDESDDV